MARAGRKRKAGPRQPNGQPKRNYDRDEGTPELRKRLMAMKGKGTVALMTDRMCAVGLLTDRQNQAAALYRWFREKGYGKPTPAIGGYGEMISEGTLRPIAVLDPEDDQQTRAQKAYRRGWDLVAAHGKPGATVELTRVVIDNAAPVERDLHRLQEALELLAQLYIGGEIEGAHSCASSQTMAKRN